MSGNAAPTLCALVGLSAPAQRGQGDVHGRSEAGAARGIGHGGRHGAGGEVTGLEAVGGALPRSGVLGGQWQCPRAAWGMLGRSLHRGAGLGFLQVGVQALGVDGSGVVEEQKRGRGFWAGLASGSLPPSMPNGIGQTEEGF
jgi:hypothetical protein